MSSNWPIVTIDEIKAKDKSSIAIGPFGSRMKSDCYVDSGIPVIRGNNLGSGPEFVNDFVYVSEDKANELASCNVYFGDLVFPHRGSIGEVGIVEGENRYVLSTSLMKLTCDAEKALPQYVYYFFKSARGRHELLKNASQVGTPGIGQPLTSLKAVEIPLPPLTAQKQIATALRALDSKIHLNQQINQTLEQMAQAIFKSWFVDFEPVKARIAALEAGGSEEDALLAAMQAISGKDEAELTRLQAEQPEQYAELRATTELFPSAMQDSELGEIPKGWYPSRLDQHIELAYGKALKKSMRVEGEYPVYGSGGVTGSHNELLVSGPGIIVGRKGTVGSIYWEPHDFYPIDTTFYVTVKNGYSLVFAYYLLQTLGLSEMNTDAAVPGLNRNNVYRLEVPSFPKTLISQFSQIITSISEKISASNAESLILTQLRDSLLPKLLSGELTVSDAKGPREEAEEPADV